MFISFHAECFLVQYYIHKLLICVYMQVWKAVNTPMVQSPWPVVYTEIEKYLLPAISSYVRSGGETDMDDVAA